MHRPCRYRMDVFQALDLWRNHGPETQRQCLGVFAGRGVLSCACAAERIAQMLLQTPDGTLRKSHWTSAATPSLWMCP